MRISDWSSDVCSSDLLAAVSVDAVGLVLIDREPRMLDRDRLRHAVQEEQRAEREADQDALGQIPEDHQEEGERKSVVEGKSVSGRVDLGGRRMIKKKNKLKKP